MLPLTTACLLFQFLVLLYHRHRRGTNDVISLMPPPLPRLATAQPLPSVLLTLAMTLTGSVTAFSPVTPGQYGGTDPFDALRSGEVHRLSDLSDLMGSRPPPPKPPAAFDRRAWRPGGGDYLRCHCYNVSEDLVRWRVVCGGPSGEHAATSGPTPTTATVGGGGGVAHIWPIASGCYCCNGETRRAEGNQDCVCKGANVTAVPQTLPVNTTLM